jgi:hypothetical protein
VYVAFGQELQKEMEQLHASGQTARLNDVRAGFEEFLDSISKREQGQTFGSLLWIAETYTSLAEGSNDEPAKATEFFGKASATYDRMAQKAASDPAFLAKPEQKTVISLRLADCRKRQGDYAAAETAMLEAVAQSPQAPNVQYEAALLYRDWGASATSAADKLLIAIRGDADKKLWGWNQLSRKLQQALMVGQRDPRVEQMHFDSRYYQAECYRLYAQQQPADEQIKNLNQAKFGIEAFARIAGSLPPADFARFDALYRQIRDDLGEPVMSLDAAIASTATSASPAAAPTEATPAAEPAPASSAAAAEAPPAKRMNFGLVVLLIVLVSAGCIGLYVLSVRNERKKKRSKRRSVAKVK